MNRTKNAEPNPKLHVGLNKKIGMPDYGSVGAHCTIEWEIDRETIAEPEVFHRRVRNAFDTCRSAVEEELSRHAQSNNPNRQGNARRRNGQGGISSKQRQYVQRLARQMPDVDIDDYCIDQFGKPLAALTSKEASRLIDDMKSAGVEHQPHGVF